MSNNNNSESVSDLPVGRGVADLWGAVDNTIQEALESEEDVAGSDSDGEDSGDSNLDDDTSNVDIPKEEEVDAADEDEDDDEDDDGDEEDAEKEEKTEDKKSTDKQYTLKATTSDGKTLEIPSDAVFRLKANGKLRDVTLSDLKKDFAGRVAYNEKLSNLTERKKEYESKILESEVHIGLIKESLDLIEAGDIGGGLELVGEVLGIEQGAYFDAMISSFDKFFTDLIVQSPEEREITVAEARLKGRQARMEYKTKSQQEISSRQEFTKQLQEFSQSYVIPEDEVKYCFDFLVKRNVDLAKEKGGKPAPVSIESIKDFAFNRKIYNNLLDVVDDLGIDLEDSAKSEIFKIIKTVDADATKLASEDYADIVNEYMKASKPISSSRKTGYKKVTPQKKLKKKSVKSLNDLWNS